MVKENRILIETCPISHEILRLTSSIAAHPMPALQARGVAIAIGNDEPAILGHGDNGLKFDFYQVLLTYENTGCIAWVRWWRIVFRGRYLRMRGIMSGWLE